jgi:16S rRNA (guanine(966)-N(2))-methyltransferase RsmD
VLDLFAGTGALGIEALSRGAASVVFVEDDRQSVELIEKNLAKTKLKGPVRKQDAFDFLQQAPEDDKFQIIFADPPYEKANGGGRYIDKLVDSEVLPRLLEPRGIFVLEKRPDEILRELKRWRVVRQKTYGATEVLFLSAAN